mmetsp:Transcript_50655/g.94355  ORF Transcript_50655/g.94355 Transcript_50655/m.94355 type:complete len:697 (+) Transcript_50655:105-2195(+)|eukprot:CAMPEP_0114238236 /NCGR_PEP_ID=MMETSP0058-20121206/7818_1 /TAXON_ID=36894 /ORGANISM="Pyramimonas parkeae, CCMP726" /LENGTH=696 /DNA_ID=CAMNT_0001350335 /DNA_START=83 /DNA_END=2173 /DNA_ORIENTATION=-
MVLVVGARGPCKTAFAKVLALHNAQCNSNTDKMKHAHGSSYPHRGDIMKINSIVSRPCCTTSPRSVRLPSPSAQLGNGNISRVLRQAHNKYQHYSRHGVSQVLYKNFSTRSSSHHVGSGLHRRQRRFMECKAGSDGNGTKPAGEDSTTETAVQQVTAKLLRIRTLGDQLIPMSALFFCMACINTFIDSTKDVLVISLSGGGAEVLPFLVPYAVLPSSIIFVMIYTFLSIRFSRRKLFNIIVIAFLAYFAFFVGVLFPNRDALHADALADAMLTVIPASLSGLVTVVRTWIFTTFYVVSELWGDVVLSLLFWGLANERTAVEDAHVMYPLFGIGANVAQTAAGQIMKYMNSTTHLDYSGVVTVLMSICIGMCGAILFLHDYISNQQSDRDRRMQAEARAAGIRSLGDDDLGPDSNDAVNAARAGQEPLARAAAAGAGPETNSKPQSEGNNNTSVLQALKFISSQSQIRCLAVMAVCQGVATNLLEVTWKGHLRLLHASPGTLSAFMGDVATYTGVATMGMMMLAPFVFTKVGWGAAASFTPQFLFAGGGLFFLGCIALQYTSFNGPVVLGALVLLGAACMILSRASKFSLFKPAEEMVYIMLDKESRTKGKAAVDVAGSQTGKAISSVLQQVLLLTGGGSIFRIIPVLAVVFFVTLVCWMNAVVDLNRWYAKSQCKTNADEMCQPKDPGTPHVIVAT